MLEHYRHSERLAFDQKLIQRRVSFEDIHDPRFVASALQALQLENYWRPAGTTASAREVLP